MKELPTKKDLENKLEDISTEMPFKEQSEIGEVFANLDNDETQSNKLSNIDFNARLSGHEISSCIIIDELIRLEILPEECGITRQKKRLSVSLDGKGRGEKVEIASASRSADLSGRSGGVLSGLFSRRE